MAESSSLSSTVVKSDAETEELLDRMLTRLALCDDSKLEALLSKLLPFTLSSLSSNSTAVLEILSHVNKRVKYQRDIGLPLQELWKLYTEADATPMVKNFCVVYIEMAFERVNIKEKENMAPMLVANISKLPLQHQDIILRIATKVIGECHASRIDEEVAVKYRLVNGSQDIELFTEFCLHLMLYQQSSQGGGGLPGLSIAQSNRVTGKKPLKSDELLMRKVTIEAEYHPTWEIIDSFLGFHMRYVFCILLAFHEQLGVLNVVEAMELGSEPVYPLYLVACADSQEAIIKKGRSSSGRRHRKREVSRGRVFGGGGTTGTEHVAPESKVNPASVSLKTKLMSVFCRSITAANSFPATLQYNCGAILHGSA
ncbi:unnamed protein product [Dovyalis caffra]|uniref:Proteasome component Ecm29 N-terminal domain-containing protein n=1 Tax=Dovyalis caffra TaxID=77055 RepID=A0AAV1RA93_9ROSI|nr:unnamed protein product [Dovyalis caffra]